MNYFENKSHIAYRCKIIVGIDSACLDGLTRAGKNTRPEEKTVTEWYIHFKKAGDLIISIELSRRRMCSSPRTAENQAGDHHTELRIFSFSEFREIRSYSVSEIVIF